MVDEPLAQFTLVIDAGSDADDEELNELRLRLRQEIDELAVDAVEDVIIPVSLEGAKGSTALALNAIDVEARPGTFAALLALIRNWVTRGVDRRVEITFQQADQPVVVKALAADLPVVLKAWAEYEELRPHIRTAPIGDSAQGAVDADQMARSGGADIEAGRVDIGGDVVGRDKIMQAGGHIIIAKEGATVIVNQSAPVNPQMPLVFEQDESTVNELAAPASDDAVSQESEAS